MKIVVIGGTGFIGTKVVNHLREYQHQVIAASPSNGINTITGEGLAEAIKAAEVVIDLSNAPSYEEKEVIDFFQTSGRNLLDSEINAGVKHHVVLSIVGVDKMQNVGYMRGKIVQEDLIKQSGVPFTIIRSTQFFEFLAGIADQATVGNEVHLSDVKIQPIAAENVVEFVAKYALEGPKNDIIEIAGPERFEMYEIVSKYLKLVNDPRKVISDNKPVYFGGEIMQNALVPEEQVELGTIGFEQWWSKQFDTNKPK